MYFEDVKGGKGVVVYLFDNNEPNLNFKLFIDGMQSVYYGSGDFQPRPYTGEMVYYSSDRVCGALRTDPYGQEYAHWAVATMTFEADWYYFRLDLDDCGDGTFIETLCGTPGL